MSSTRWWQPISRAVRRKQHCLENPYARLCFATTSSLTLLAGFGALQWNSDTCTDTTRMTSTQICRKIWGNAERTISCRQTACEEFIDDTDQLYPSGYTESERFFQSLEYHRSLIQDYLRRWTSPDGEESKDSITWPRHIPRDSEIGRLQVDLEFCQKSPAYRNEQKLCRDKEFQIATYYVRKSGIVEQKKGVKMIKDLAARGHPDSMCMYGIILNEGKLAGIEANPELAVVWWKRCVDFHKHMTASFELGLALYTGEGLPENTELAIKYFARAAHLGHAGAAYMLGECLLDGIGIARDRASALEWLVTAAELGHHLARKRVIVIIQNEYDDLDEGNDGIGIEASREEARKWVNESNEEIVKDVNIERRFTVGGGSSNPQVLARRKTKIAESRDREGSD